MSERLRTARVLWGALFASTVMFLVVLFVVPRPEPEQPDPMLPPLLAVVALVVLATSIVLPRQQVMVAAKAASFVITEEADPNASDVIPYRDAPKRRVFANPKAAVARAFALYNTKLILEMALSEAITLFGFVVGYLGHPLPFFLPFFLVGWASMAMRFPTPQRVVGPLERAYDAHLPLDRS